MKDAELVRLFENLNKETNHKKIHEYYQKKIKKLYQELIKYKYDRNIVKSGTKKEVLNDNDKALNDLKDMGNIRNGFVNKKIATRALIAQDKLTYYGQALQEEEIDMTWIQLCTLLKVTDKKQVVKTVKGYHEKLPNYLNLKETLITLINTVDPLGAVVPMTARNSDDYLKYLDRLVQHITKLAEHTARTKPSMLTPIRDPLPIRKLSTKSSFQSFQKINRPISTKSSISNFEFKKSNVSSSIPSLPRSSHSNEDNRKISSRSIKSSSKHTASSKRDSKSDIHLTVSPDSVKKHKADESDIQLQQDDNVSITSSMIDRIINEVPVNKTLSNASFDSSQAPDLGNASFLEQYTQQSIHDDETLNTDFLNDISRHLRISKEGNGSSVSDL